MSVRIAHLLTCFACVVLSVSSCSLSKSSDVNSAVARSSVAPSEVGAKCPGVPTESVSLVAKNLSFRPFEDLRRNSDVVTNVECYGHNDKRLMVFLFALWRESEGEGRPRAVKNLSSLAAQ